MKIKHISPYPVLNEDFISKQCKQEKTIPKFFDSNKKIAEARYVKVIARNFGKLPEWHIGHPYNGEAFIFIDEIIIK